LNYGGLQEHDRERLLFLEEFIDRLEQEEEFESAYILRVKNEIEQAWNESKYPKDTCIQFVFLSGVLLSCVKENMDLGIKMLLEAKIMVSAKDKKRGKRGIISRYLKSYHKEHIRNSLRREYMDIVLMKHCEQIKANPTLEQIESKIKKLGMETVLSMLYIMMKNETLIHLMEAHFPIEVLAFNARTYLSMRQLNFEQVMEAPEQISDINDSKVLQRKNKELALKLNKTQKSASNLRKEIHTFQQKERELRSEVYHLNQAVENTYEQALFEIENLKEQLKQQEVMFQIEREFYVSTIAKLCSNEESEVNDQADVNLSGKRICVIGGNKERHYREVVESYNGTIEFVSSDDYNKVEGAISRSHVVFFLKDIIRHHLFYKSYQTARERDIPFIFVNTLGMSTFERELRMFAKDNGMVGGRTG